jgi:hypothetical protein
VWLVVVSRHVGGDAETDGCRGEGHGCDRHHSLSLIVPLPSVIIVMKLSRKRRNIYRGCAANLSYLVRAKNRAGSLRDGGTIVCCARRDEGYCFEAL